MKVSTLFTRSFQVTLLEVVKVYMKILMKILGQRTELRYLLGREMEEEKYDGGLTEEKEEDLKQYRKRNRQITAHRRKNLGDKEQW